ncbi:MAG: hypothetical protein R3E01_36165 [Pirellulaceae bacterium]|nr:hypothetical protein [Planctomycetales bacterium]
MRLFAKSAFLKNCPGPYFYRPGREGVDDTYDVYCLASENHIISTYYWEAEEDARRIAGIVTAALNRQAGGCELDGEDFAEHLAYLRTNYPGPYRTYPDTCPLHGPFIGVWCGSTGDLVVLCVHVGKPTAARYTAAMIAHSLNALVGHQTLVRRTLRRVFPVR